MPREKDLKRLVRARMKKTGEAYTAARAQLLRKSKDNAPPNKSDDVASTSSVKRLTPNEYAALAGMSDAVIAEKTGRGWHQWVDTLDSQGAATMRHRDIAEIVSSKYGVGDWWSQSVTVGYERIKGLRAIGQRRDGSYEVNKSRTYDVPVKTLFHAWNDASKRKRWLDATGVKVRSATSPKSVRFSWPDGTVVVVGFLAKGKGKSAAAVAHQKLPDKDTSTRLKQYWSDQLDALGKVLKS